MVDYVVVNDGIWIRNKESIDINSARIVKIIEVMPRSWISEAGRREQSVTRETGCHPPDL